METGGAVLRSGRLVGSHDVEDGSLVILGEERNNESGPIRPLSPNVVIDGLTDGSVRPRTRNPNVLSSSANSTETSLEAGTRERSPAVVEAHEFARGDGANIAEMIKATVEASIKESLSSIQSVCTPKASSQSLDQDLLMDIQSQPRFRDCQRNDVDLPRAQRERSTSLIDRTQSVSNAAQGRPGNKVKSPSYDGTSSWPDFLIQFNMVSELNGWTQQEKLLYLGCSLKGVAREVLGDIDSSMRASYEGLVQCLNQRFGPENQEEVFRALLKNRTQQRDESFPELAHAIRRLVKNTYPDATYRMLERMARDHFIDAIGDANVRNIVYYREPSTLDEAVRVAIKVKNREEYDNPKVKRAVSARAVTFADPEITVQKPEVDVQKELVQTFKGMQGALETVSEQVYNLPQARKPYKSNNSGAYKSGRKGPGVVVCFNCGEEGHKIRDCSSRPPPPPRYKDRESQTQRWHNMNRHSQGQGN